MANKYPNVITVHESYDGVKTDYTEIAPYLVPLLEALVVKYPQWEFRIGRTRSTKYREENTADEASGFHVFNNDNPRRCIGFVGVDYTYKRSVGRKDYFFIECDRLAKDRERGTALQTTKLDVAMKAVKKYFTPAQLPELMANIAEIAYGVVYNEVRTAHMQAGWHRQALSSAVDRLLKNNWDWFLSQLDAAELKTAIDLKQYVTLGEELEKLEQAMKAEEMLIVMPFDDKYVVQYKDNRTTYTVDDVPLYIRERIGMLKLLGEKNKLIADVGGVVETSDGAVGYVIYSETKGA